MCHKNHWRKQYNALASMELNVLASMGLKGLALDEPLRLGEDKQGRAKDRAQRIPESQGEFASTPEKHSR